MLCFKIFELMCSTSPSSKAHFVLTDYRNLFKKSNRYLKYIKENNRTKKYQEQGSHYLKQGGMDITDIRDVRQVVGSISLFWCGEYLKKNVRGERCSNCGSMVIHLLILPNMRIGRPFSTKGSELRNKQRDEKYEYMIYKNGKHCDQWLNEYKNIIK